MLVVCGASGKRVSASCTAFWRAAGRLHRMTGQSIKLMPIHLDTVHTVRIQNINTLTKRHSVSYSLFLLEVNLRKLLEVYFGPTSRSTQIILCDIASDMLTVWQRNGEALAKLVSRVKKKLEANFTKVLIRLMCIYDVQDLSIHDVWARHNVSHTCAVLVPHIGSRVRQQNAVKPHTSGFSLNTAEK